MYSAGEETEINVGSVGVELASVSFARPGALSYFLAGGPMAYAMGFILVPLRGSDDSSTRWAFSFRTFEFALSKLPHLAKSARSGAPSSS